MTKLTELPKHTFAVFNEHKNILLSLNSLVYIDLIQTKEFFLELDHFQQNNFTRLLPNAMRLELKEKSLEKNTLLLTDYHGHFFRSFVREMCQMSINTPSIFCFKFDNNHIEFSVDQDILFESFGTFNNEDLLSSGCRPYSISQYIDQLSSTEHINYLKSLITPDTEGNSFLSFNNKSMIHLMNKVSHTQVSLPVFLPFLYPNLTYESKKLYTNVNLLNFITSQCNAVLVIIAFVFFNGSTDFSFPNFVEKNSEGLDTNLYTIYLKKVNTVLAFFTLIIFLGVINKSNKTIYSAPKAHNKKHYNSEYNSFYFGFLSNLINELISEKPFSNQKMYSLVDIHNILIQ